MAELYGIGIQRIFYKTLAQNGLVITAKLFDPSFQVIEYSEFVKVPGTDGVYFVGVDFYCEGIWMVIFYENGIEKAVQAYNTKKIPSSATAVIKGSGSGNLLNR